MITLTEADLRFVSSPGPVISYKLRYIVGFGLVEMDISTNPKPTMYRNLYEITDPVFPVHHAHVIMLTLYVPQRVIICQSATYVPTKMVFAHCTWNEKNRN